MFERRAERRDVFWQPILYALGAWVVFGLVGLGMAGPEGGMALGGLMGSLAWTVGFVTWLSILRESYAVQEGSREQGAGSREEVEEEAEVQEERLVARSEDGSRQRFLRPPCSASQLHAFCLGMVRQEPTTFNHWVLQRHEFTQEQFKAFRAWLVEGGFARVVDGSQVALTPEGMELAEWVFERGVRLG